MSEQQTYRQITKATSLFGGVQVFQIIILIIRSKIIAILLGPYGIGILGLLSSTTSLISGFTNLGLGTSAVKDLSVAHKTEDDNRISTVSLVFRRLVWVTGLVGASITLILSPWLSQFTFGNNDYTSAFMWLSITVLFNQITVGELGILQGLRRLKFLAKANLYGSSIGLIITIPLYYKLGLNAIVPSIIIFSLVSLTVSLIFSRKVFLKPIYVSLKRTLEEGRNMATMGTIISISVVLALASSYVLRVYIGRFGSIADVGLFSAGIAIVTTYVGMIFNAMGADFLPRLSAVSSDDKICFQTINQQAEIAILFLAPILSVFFIFINYVIILFYSNQFLPISSLMLWAALGMFFRVIIWIMGFLYLAKGRSKIYFWNEFASIVYTLLLNGLGYYLGGLTGIGISIFCAGLISMLQSLVISRIKFSFMFDLPFIRIFLIHFSLATIAFMISKAVPSPYSYIFGVVLIAFSILFSYIELDKRIGIGDLFIKRNNKQTHK